ncbi:N-glycanase [Pseudoprevotella muciniphila]|uniref:N-glycanase n=1 Tax=Pseudoprevotella muciniphila TaxID=2133944 RepID=A0A5P8E8D1_9BACT|nr:peptide-N-glycosidase F-related protein [Pseudoprevotella muciniphila]QFQ13150.1 N-glycanase [Pseudoprevotella muciniphila]
MKLKHTIAIIFALLATTLSAARYDTVYNRVIFQNQIVNFDPDVYPNGFTDMGSHLVVGNGRIVLKKICLPRYARDTRVSITVRLTSNGDPWDKTGSIFVIPATSEISMIGVAQERQKYPILDSTRYERLRGIISSEGYQPTVELIRFITPFGVGGLNPTDSISRERRTPVYIDGFAPYVEWEQDITDRLPLLQDSVYIGLAIDSWLKAGYKATVTLTVTESTLKADKAPKRRVLPLLNTIQYFGQEYCDIFARRHLEVPFALPSTAKNVTLHYVTTGHGGQEGGDEFSPCENVISLDGNEVKRFTPWRNDCASFRRFNPSTGVWLKQRDVQYIGHARGEHKIIEEPIASSDLSRSGWCPGSDVPPVNISLGTLVKGNHSLNIAIPKAQPMSDNNQNHWLISAWLTWEE